MPSGIKYRCLLQYAIPLVWIQINCLGNPLLNNQAMAGPLHPWGLPRISPIAKHSVLVSSSLFMLFAQFLSGFPYRFQRLWTVLRSIRRLLDALRVEAWNSLLTLCFLLAVSLRHSLKTPPRSPRQSSTTVRMVNQRCGGQVITTTRTQVLSNTHPSNMGSSSS